MLVVPPSHSTHSRWGGAAVSLRSRLRYDLRPSLTAGMAAAAAAVPLDSRLLLPLWSPCTLVRISSHSRHGRSGGATSTDTRRSLLLSIRVPPSLNFWSCNGKAARRNAVAHALCFPTRLFCKFGRARVRRMLPWWQPWSDPGACSGSASLGRTHAIFCSYQKPVQEGWTPPCAALRCTASQASCCSLGTERPQACTLLTSGVPASKGCRNHLRAIVASLHTFASLQSLQKLQRCTDGIWFCSLHERLTCRSAGHWSTLTVLRNSRDGRRALM
jgi:hypothetical protein